MAARPHCVGEKFGFDMRARKAEIKEIAANYAYENLPMERDQKAGGDEPAAA